jgi:hypothetical protein
MKTKKFYTVAELANLFHITKTNVESCLEAHRKFPDDEIITYNLQHAYKTANELDSLLEKLNAVDIVIDYYEGIDRTTGNNKIYTK